MVGKSARRSGEALAQAAWAARGMVALVALAAIIAWRAGFDGLDALLPGTRMRFTTAVSLLLLAGASGAAATRHPRRALVARGLAGLVVAVAALMLAEYALHVDLGIDQLLFRDPPHVLGTLPPGRMAPSTCVVLALLAGATLCSTFPGKRLGQAAQALALAASAVAALALTDLAYAAGHTADVSPWRQIAASTAAALLLVGFSVLALRPEIGVVKTLASRRPGGVLARRLVLPIALLPIVVGWARVEAERIGLVDTSFGVALMAVAMVLLLGGLVVVSAMSLDKAERARAAGEIERRSAEREVRAAKHFLDAALEDLPAMIFVKSALDLRFERLNKKAEAIIGMPRADLLGKTDLEVFPEQQAEAFRADDRLALAGKRVEVPAELLDTAHGPRWLRTKKVGIPGPDGEPRWLLGISEDITDEKRALDALQRAKDDAERANKELEAFSYSVSHDLRAPLRAIAGFSQVLAEDYAAVLDAQGKDYLARVQAGADRMGQLIDDLLGLAKVTRAEIKRTKVDLAPIAREIVDELREADPSRDVELVVGKGLVAEADPQLARIVLQNLLANAWKFTAKRRKARLEVGRKDDGFFVKDDGAGFDMKYAQKLFGAFQRLHAATEFEGTGVGLATVQRIVRRHGGSIRAEAEIDQGATFTFTLG